MCLTCEKCLINDVHDDCVSKFVNDLPDKKNVAKGPSAKSRYVGNLIKRLRNTANSRTPRDYLQHCVWIPTGREFTLKDGELKVVNSKNVETSHECDYELTFNPMEPISQRFPNTSSSVIGRLSKYVFGSSTRVAPST